MRSSTYLVIALIALALSPVPRVGAEAIPLDYDVPEGRFYAQANGRGGAGGSGFSVTDEGGIPFWSEFQRLGGVPAFGYPI